MGQVWGGRQGLQGQGGTPVPITPPSSPPHIATDDHGWSVVSGRGAGPATLQRSVGQPLRVAPAAAEGEGNP